MLFVNRLLTFMAVVLCIGSIDALSEEEKAEVKEALQPFAIECAEKFGVTEEQFEESKKKGSAAEVDPCFMSCFLKKAEFFDSKGMFDVEKSASFAESHIKSDAALNFIEKIRSECVKVNDEEVGDGEAGCERAKLLFDCIIELKKANNIED